MREQLLDIVPIDDETIKHQQALADRLTEDKVLPGEVKFDDIVTQGLIEGGSQVSVTLHWFLPTTGDARGILGAGSVVGAHHVRAGSGAGERPPSVDYLGPDRPLGRAARVRGGADADRLLVRGRVGRPPPR